MADTAVLYAGVYDDVNSALADLDAVEHMYEDNMLGEYDASVIDKEQGKPHIVRRVDRPSRSAVSQSLGSAVPSQNDLEGAADALTGSEAGLIVVGEPKLDEQAWDEAVTRASKVVKRDFDMQTDEIADELKQAFRE